MDPTRDARQARWALACLTLLAAFARIEPLNDEDVWWHLRAGEQIAKHHTFKLIEDASFLRLGDTWVDSQWLFDWILHWTFRLLGLAGPTLLASACAAASTWLLGTWCTRLSPSRPWLALLCTALATAAINASFVPRPQSPALVMMIGMMLLVDGAPVAPFSKPSRKWLVSLVLLQIVWAHSHDSHVLIPLTLGTLAGAFAMQGEQEQAITWGKLLLVTTTSSLLLGPLGTKVASRLMQHQGTYAVHHIEEWSPLRLEDLFPQHYHHGVWQLAVLVIAVGSVIARRNARMSDLAFFALGAGLTLVAKRFESLWVVFAVPLILRGSSPTETPILGRWVDRPLALAAVLLVLPSTWYAVGPPWPRPAFSVWEPRFPVHAMDFLTFNNARGRILNHYNDGGYISFRGSPKLQVAIDGRTPAFFSDEDFTEWADSLSNPVALDGFLERHRADFVLWPRDVPLCSTLRQNPKWRALYVDSYRVVFARRGNGFWGDHELRASPVCASEPDVPFRCQQAQGVSAEVLREADVLETMSPRAPWPWILRLYARSFCSDAQDPTLAARAAHEALLRGADDPQTMTVAALALRTIGEAMEALEAVKLGLKYPGSARLRVIQGIILRSLGDNEGAVDAFEKGEAELDRSMAPKERLEFAFALVGTGRPDDAAKQALAAAHAGLPEAFELLRRLLPMVDPALRDRIQRLLPS